MQSRKRVGYLFLLGLLGLLIGMMTQVTAQVPTVAGDCDGNGRVDGADINILRTAIENNNNSGRQTCDANGDGRINAADLACIPILISGGACRSQRILGSNLDDAINFSSQYAFSDPFKQSSQWYGRKSPDQGGALVENPSTPIDVDEDGWVRSLPDCGAGSTADYCTVASFMLTEFGPNYPTGEYLVMHDGRGLLTFDGQGVAIDFSNGNTCTTCDPAFYTLRVDDVSTGQGIVMNLVQSDPDETGNYVRNIRVYPPGYAPAHPNPNHPRQFEEARFGELFHQDFLRSLQPYSALRFMDWMQTNWADADNGAYGPLLNWADRPELDDARYSTRKGTPVETMVSLTNEANIAPWFNIPHRASNEYVTQFARYVRDNITVDQSIYIEYSNEIWNTDFEQGDWMTQQALQTFPVSPPNTVSAQHALYKWYGKRTNEICRIFEQEFGNSSGRIKCVVSGQANNTNQDGTGGYLWMMDSFLNCDFFQNCAHTSIDAVAIAPYFGADLGLERNTGTVAGWSLDTLFRHLTVEGLLGDSRSALQQARDNMSLYATAAAARNVQLYAYEGGQHLAGVGSNAFNNTITNLFINANRDPRMQGVYTAYLNDWINAGGNLFMHFNHVSPYNNFGSWGAQEFYGQNSPKANALSGFTNRTYTPRRAELSFGQETSSGSFWSVPLEISAGGSDLQALSFVLEYDKTQLTPQSISLEQNRGNYTIDAEHNNNGLWSITISPNAGTSANNLRSGVLLKINMTARAKQGDGIRVLNGSSGGGRFQQPLTCGSGSGGFVPCGASGRALFNTDGPTTDDPAATATPRPSATARPGTTPVPTSPSDGGDVVCVIPESGPWPPCARDGNGVPATPAGSTPPTNPDECVIPASGPWPPCARDGGGSPAPAPATPTPGGEGECIIPESGPWPPCARGGGGTSPTPPPPTTGEDCVIPVSGPWPPCATGGGGTPPTNPAPQPTVPTPTPASGQPNECVIPESGPWPPCATDGAAPPPDLGDDCVIPAVGPWPACALDT